MKKLILFDFDKTITKMDSVVILIKYYLPKKLWIIIPWIIRLLKFFIIDSVFFTKMNAKNLKNVLLYPLNFFSEDELREFIKYLNENYIIEDARKKVESFNKSENFLMLVSASSESYLKFLYDYFPFDVIMGTRVNEKNEIIGENNRHEEKVRRILEYIKENNLELDFENGEGYSDSYSADSPMLELVGNRYLINSEVKKEGYTNLSWS